MSEKFQVTYGPETWAKGSRGRGSSFDQEGRAFIENMRVLKDGSLCVRPAWFRWGWHGGAAAFQVLSGYDQTRSHVFYPTRYRSSAVSATTLADGFVVLDTGGVKVFDRDTVTNPPTVLWSSTSVLGLSKFGIGHVDHIDRHTAFVQGKVIRTEGVGAAAGSITDGVTALATAFMPSGEAYSFVGSTIHQGRAFYWGFVHETTNNTLIRHNRVWYSDTVVANDYSAYTTFTADTQFFDVDGEVRGAVSIGPNLLIWTVEGNWFILQGRGDPSNATLHTKGRNRIPPLDDQGGRYQEMALFYSADFDTISVVDRDGRIDSATLDRFGAETVANIDVRRSPIAPSPEKDAMTIPTYVLGNAVHFSRGTWVDETWEDLTYYYSDRSTLRSYAEENLEFLTVAIETSLGSGLWDLHVHQREILANTPSKYASGTGTDPDETVDGAIHLPRIWDPDFDVRIMQITVDAKYWKTASGDTYDANAMTIEVADTTTGGTNHATTIGPDATQISSLPALEGGLIRLVATPTVGTLEFQSWTEVILKDIRSFAVQQIMVEYETSSRRHH